MPVGSQDLAGLIARLLSDDPTEREDAAEQTCDWIPAFELQEADLAVRVLALVASTEADTNVRESQLHAILEVMDQHDIDRTALTPLRNLDVSQLEVAQQEYLREMGIEAVTGGDSAHD